MSTALARRNKSAVPFDRLTLRQLSQTVAILTLPAAVLIAQKFASPLYQLVMIAPYWGVVVLTGALQNPLNVRLVAPRMTSLLVLAYIAVMATAAARGLLLSGQLARMALFVTILLIPALIFFRADSPSEKRRFASLALGSLGFVVGLNVFLWVLGYHQVADSYYGRAVVLGIIGLSQDRVLFPLAGGVNNFGGVGAAAVVAGVLVGAGRGQGRFLERLTGAVMITTGTTVVLLTDNRGALLFAVLTLCTLFVLRAIRLRRFAAIIVVLPVLAVPFVGSGFLSAVEETAVIQGLSRGNSDFATLNGRIAIWAIALDFATRSPLMLLVGHGLDGHVASGAAAEIGELFPIDDPYRYSHTAHNLSLQAMLDVGLLGLALILGSALVGVYLSLRNASEGRVYAALGGAVLYFCLAGATDGHLTPEIADSYPFVAMLMLAALILPGAAQCKKRPETDVPRVGAQDE